ncbi:hypothetical protein Atc_1137 [Acidithiobacillus caldus SM-1]|uniref:Uncharacterized protein n=1 Tax=Acidithiobacillus caldus (strain SM-1) TaxID=990288 RepID=F9ZLB7_ACICS|nr:hypothetical protein Atc_1137 [Acidithiobacillus caldus SM-1]QER43340.1 hypothetical protein F0726_00251 [Acidithiobacillus caldus]
MQYANDAAKEKNAFLGKVINNAIQYFVDNATYVIWKSEKIFV